MTVPSMRERTRWQWQPTLTAHDPMPPVTLESPVATATITPRLPIATDAPVWTSAALAAGARWGDDTMGNYLLDSNVHMAISDVEWPAGLVNAPAAVCMTVRIGSEARVQLLAIDPAVIPDVPANAILRQTIADRVLRHSLAQAVVAGALTGTARKLPVGGNIEAYVDSIPGVTKSSDGTGLVQYSMNLVQAIAFLLARSG